MFSLFEVLKILRGCKVAQSLPGLPLNTARAKGVQVIPVNIVEYNHLSVNFIIGNLPWRGFFFFFLSGTS